MIPNECAHCQHQMDEDETITLCRECWDGIQEELDV